MVECPATLVGCSKCYESNNNGASTGSTVSTNLICATCHEGHYWDDVWGKCIKKDENDG